MIGRTARLGALVLAGVLGMSKVQGATAPPAPAGAQVEQLAFATLPGWAEDDHAAAFATFLISCRAMAADAPELRPALAALPRLKAICQAALASDAQAAAGGARRFFEQHFAPWRIIPPTGHGFLTGYYEPVVAGSLTPTPDFAAPVLGRPADLVTLQPGDTRGLLASELSAARTTPDGLQPFPDRAAILAGALAGQGLEQLYLRDAPEVFIIQVQGSARVRLTDGRTVRLVYSGRNGHPYTSIGRLLIERGAIPAAQMSLSRLMGWLRANPEEARQVMAANRSYVFFAVRDEIDPALGPIGGAGVPLTPGRSIAVDRSIWPYGLPVFLSAGIETLGPSDGQIARLMIAQDTGSAILGPARADYFWGSGEEAGRRAGLTRHPLEFTVLWPKESDRQ